MAHSSTTPAGLLGKRAKLVGLAPKQTLGIGSGAGGRVVLVVGSRRKSKFGRRK